MGKLQSTIVGAEHSRSATPSVILFRRADRSPAALAALLLANLDTVAADLDKGAFVLTTEDRDPRLAAALTAGP